MSFCTKCETEIKDETANFCSKCGANLGKFLGLKLCPICGKNTLSWNNQNWLYQCSNPECRARITLAETQTQGTPPSENRIITGKEINPKSISHRNKTPPISVAFLSVIVVLLVVLLGIASLYYHNQLNEQKLQAQRELNSFRSQLTFAQGQLTSTKAQLESTQNELALYKDTWGSVVASNVIPPFQDANIVNQPTATNPTWAQLQNFILSDKTDENIYTLGVYTCGEYARDVHNNAERVGIRAAYVAIKFSDDWHACNAFKTTDRGLVFIDCTGLSAGQAGPSNHDKIVNVKLGKDYVRMSLVPQTSRLDYWGDWGTILAVQVYW